MARRFAIALGIFAVCALQVARGQAARPLPSVWCAIKFRTPGNVPVGVLPNVVAELRSTRDNGAAFKQRYSSEASGSWVSAALSTGRIQFRNVPTGVPLLFRLSYTSPTGASDAYEGTYAFAYPALNAAQRAMGKKDDALEIAGYLGDLSIDYSSAKITYASRFATPSGSRKGSAIAGNVVAPPATATETLAGSQKAIGRSLGITDIPTQVGSVQPAPRQGVGSAHGRLWDFIERPIPSGLVFAMSVDGKTILDYSETISPRGPNQGAWRLHNLPTGDVLLVGFDRELLLGVASAKIRIQANGDLFFNTLTTRLVVPQTGPGSMQSSESSAGAAPMFVLDLLAVIAREANRISGQREGEALEARLLAYVAKRRSTQSAARPSPSGQTPQRDAPLVRNVMVSSQNGWQDTGIELNSGQTLVIQASGTVRFDSSSSLVSPDGRRDAASETGTSGCTFLLCRSGIPQQSLVGRIGVPDLHDSQSGFLVGSILRITVATPGRLLLGFNDGFVLADRSGLSGGGVRDNSGMFGVSVTIDR